MTDNKLDVLLDLSYATLGNSGIPLDTRWLFKQLSNNKSVNLTGLIYPFANETSGFNIPSKNDKDMLLRYSQYLALMSMPIKNEDGMNHFLFLRVLNKLKKIYKTYLKPNFEIWLKENNLFNDVIYRQLFESGLDPKDKDIVLNGKFAFTNYYKFVQLGRVFSPIKLPMPRLDTKGYDIIINQDSIPIKVSKGTQQIIRYHDPIQLTTPDAFQTPFDAATLHYVSTKFCVKNGAIYICNSEPVQEELLNIFPTLEGRITTIPYTISDVYKPTKNINHLLDILQSKISPKVAKHKASWHSYFEMMRKKPEDFHYITEVATIEPRKNHIKLIRAFNIAKEKIKAEKGVDLKLIIVGEIGWKFKKILDELEPFVERGDIVLMQGMHPNELKYLYSHSQAFVYPTLKEGFGLPPVEAMLCGTPVISSNIKVHRWVQGDASYYVDPYDEEDIAKTIVHVVVNRNGTDVSSHIKKGLERGKRFNAIEAERRWNLFFQEYRSGKYKV